MLSGIMVCRLMQKKVKLASLLLKDAAFRIQSSDSKARLWEDEGKAAGVYFRALDEMIPQQKKNFVFSDRKKRLPADK